MPTTSVHALRSLSSRRVMGGVLGCRSAEELDTTLGGDVTPSTASTEAATETPGHSLVPNPDATASSWDKLVSSGTARVTTTTSPEDLRASDLAERLSVETVSFLDGVDGVSLDSTLPRGEEEARHALAVGRSRDSPTDLAVHLRRGFTLVRFPNCGREESLWGELTRGDADRSGGLSSCWRCDLRASGRAFSTVEPERRSVAAFPRRRGLPSPDSRGPLLPRAEIPVETLGRAGCSEDTLLVVSVSATVHPASASSTWLGVQLLSSLLNSSLRRSLSRSATFCERGNSLCQHLQQQRRSVKPRMTVWAIALTSFALV